jgi:hypothetical protein
MKNSDATGKGKRVRDCFWLWGHAEGVHNNGWGLPGLSRMTPVEASFYLGAPNVIMVRYEGKPAPPYHQYALPFKAIRETVWSIVGAAGATGAEERQAALDLRQTLPNLSGVMMDDFFKNAAPTTPDGLAVLSVEELRQVRAQLAGGGRRLDLWVVLYDHQLSLPVGEHLAQCDKVSFWTWKGTDLVDLEANFARAEALAPAAGKVLGCYMWDYGQGKPMPVAWMERQCELGLRWLREGRIEGMIFLATCIGDLGLETVEWTREWIARVGDEQLGAAP